MRQRGHRPLWHGLAQQAPVARRGADQAQEDADGRRLSRAIRAEEPVRAARRDGQVYAINRAQAPEMLGQATSLDRHTGGLSRQRPAAGAQLWAEAAASSALGVTKPA